MIEYNINELENLLGYPAATIRYYEKRGIVSPSRKHNGYRVFTRNDVYNLIDCNRYSSFGMTLKEISEFYTNTDENYVVETLQKYNEKRRKETIVKNCTTHLITNILETLELMPMRGNDIYVKKIPPQYYTKINYDNISGWDLKLSEFQIHVSAIASIKRVFHYPSNIYDPDELGAYFIDEQYFHTLGIDPSHKFHTLPEQYCFCKSVKIKDLNELDEHIKVCTNYAVSKGYRIADHVYADSLIRVKINNSFIRYTEIQIPIQKNGL